MEDILLIQLDSEYSNAQVPVRGSSGSAGYDLYACIPVAIAPQGWGVVETGIRMKIPSGCYGRIASRSGLAMKYGIMVGGGVVDSDYRGLVKVLLFNSGEEAFHVMSGDRIAQLIIEKIRLPIVQVVTSLEQSERGEAGFGSTGVRD